MNIASPELCRTLCDLSRWDETPMVYGNFWEEGYIYEFGAYQRSIVDGFTAREESQPAAYDLGYLMRKLADQSSTVRVYNTPAGAWRARSDHFYREADTTEDAAAKLAIKFFKAGILKRIDPLPSPDAQR